MADVKNIEIKTAVYAEVKKNKAFKEIFKKSFRGKSWANAIPYVIDDVIYAEKNGKIVGYCMLHDRPPYKFDDSQDGYYLYNLCVLPKERRKGIATALVKKACDEYKIVHCHHNSYDTSGHKWFHDRGFLPQKMWRGEYMEFTYPLTAVSKSMQIDELYKRIDKLKTTGHTHYDPVENIVYLN